MRTSHGWMTNWLVPLVLGAVFVVLLALSTTETLIDLAPSDTDDAMRLVQGRDLAEGQAWSDLTQHRLNPPGTPMHWTRHIDALVAPLVLTMDGNRGLVAASLVVPAVGLGLLLVGVALATDRLGRQRDRWIMVLGALTSAAALTQFFPGRVDHHGLQIAFVVLGAAALIAGHWSLGGALVGFSLGVGLDALPPVAGLLVALTVAWVIDPERWASAMSRVPGAIVAAAVASSVVFAPDGRLLSTACDVLSTPFVAALALAAIGLGVSRWLGPPTWVGRLTVGVASGLASAAGLLLIRPACVLGPYADVPDDVATRWLDNVSETRSILVFFSDRPLTAAAVCVPIVVALVLTVRDVARGRHRLVLHLGLLAGAAGVLLLQIRGIGMAGALALLPLALLIEPLRSRPWPGGRVGAGLMTIVGLLIATGFIPLALAQVAGVEPSETSGLVGCSGAENLAILDRVEPGLVLAHIDMGSAILLHSDHAVLGAPYHRNVEGIRATFDLLGGPSDGTSLAAAGVDHVVVCPSMATNGAYTATGETSLMSRLLAGDDVDGIDPVDLSSHVWLFTVTG